MRVTVHIPDSLGPSLKQEAQREGISVSALTARALESYLKQKKKKEAGLKLLRLVGTGAVAPDADVELERGRIDNRS